MARRFGSRFPRRTTGSRGRNASESRQPSFPAPDASVAAIAQNVARLLDAIEIEDGAPAESIYISSEGHIGLGVDPTATATEFGFISETAASFWKFRTTTDSAAALQIQGGATQAENLFIQFLTNTGALTWQIVAIPSGDFRIGYTSNNVLIFEDGADPNSIHVDGDGRIGFGIDPSNPTALARWHFDAGNNDLLGETAGNEQQRLLIETRFAAGGNRQRFRITSRRHTTKGGGDPNWSYATTRLEHSIDDNGSAQMWIELRSSNAVASNSIVLGEAGTTEWVRVEDGAVGIETGTASNNAAAQLQGDSTTKGWLPPRMTTTQRDAISSPPDGLFIYNSTDDYLGLRANSEWEDIALQGHKQVAESVSRTINNVESAFIQMANISFPGPTNGTATYLVTYHVSINTVSALMNVGIKVRMGQNGNTTDAVQDYKLEVMANQAGGGLAEEYHIGGAVAVTPASGDVLTLTHITSNGTASAVVNADGRGGLVNILRVA